MKQSPTDPGRELGLSAESREALFKGLNQGTGISDYRKAG